MSQDSTMPKTPTARQPWQFRRTAATLAGVVGLGMCVYGFGFRVIPVIVEKEVVVPASLDGPAGLGLSVVPLPGGPRPESEPALPLLTPLQKMEISVLFESELELMLETTVGGVERLAGGQLRRTYTGKPPSRCPT